MEETNYYPFGLAHSGYNEKNNTIGKNYKYRYNTKEYQDELGLNLYDYGARNYDAAIGRWMNVDPLAEKMPNWNPYASTFNNPIRFTDPTGMIGEDWVKHESHGQSFITYDSGVKSVNEAQTKGYKNVTNVFKEGTGNSGLGETIDFKQGGIYSVNGGNYKSVQEATHITEGGTTINWNKSYTQQVASVFSGIGDLTAVGAATSTATGFATPVGAVLGTISLVTGGIGAGLEVLDGVFNSETINMNNPEQAVTKTATNVLAPMLLKKVPLNNVEGPIIDMLIMGTDKAIDYGRSNLVGPFYPGYDK
ncbi:RHS repeat-associated core domain-containing protein [Myroides sp. WP-1]|uniref:RHS repeat-associated core domain-containing protein n=1 Tax=Myroides sp. WP-1 TaxID=2759944 RepID=UPI00351BFEB2